MEILSKIQGETHFVVIGKINNKHSSGVITYRDQNIRIISVCRSRIQEVALLIMNAKEFDRKFDDAEEDILIYPKPSAPLLLKKGLVLICLSG